MTEGTFEDLKAKLSENQDRSVTNDMLAMMESRLPKGAFGAPPYPPAPGPSGGAPFQLGDRLKMMEEETRKMREKLDELVSSKSATAAEENLMVGTQETMAAAVDSLARIVGDFNASLRTWYEKSGCVANFCWTYHDDCKLLEIAGIDVIVYRKDAPSPLAIKEALESAPTQI